MSLADRCRCSSAACGRIGFDRVGGRSATTAVAADRRTPRRRWQRLERGSSAASEPGLRRRLRRGPAVSTRSASPHGRERRACTSSNSELDAHAERERDDEPRLRSHLGHVRRGRHVRRDQSGAAGARSDADASSTDATDAAASSVDALGANMLVATPTARRRHDRTPYNPTAASLVRGSGRSARGTLAETLGRTARRGRRSRSSIASRVATAASTIDDLRRQTPISDRHDPRKRR